MRKLINVTGLSWGLVGVMGVRECSFAGVVLLAIAGYLVFSYYD
jgi:hypothetical protein